MTTSAVSIFWREIAYTSTEPEFIVQEEELVFSFLPDNPLSLYGIPVLPCR